MVNSDPQLPSDAPTIGDGRFVITERVGEGGMSGVYRAYDTHMRTWRAVKVLLPKFAKKRKIRARFEAEAHTLARLEHPNLVRVYDVGDASTLPYLVMELVSGGTLVHWTHLNGAMPPHMAVSCVIQVCRGVVAVHQGGVVHRDIKPHNVLIATDGTCKLTDFGIAQGTGDNLTKTGSAMGTLGYMCPEQRSDAKSVDARADVFGLGATLWHLLKAEIPSDIFMCEDNPSMLNDVPGPVRAMLTRAVAYNREDRHPDVEALLADLIEALSALELDPPYAPGLVLQAVDDPNPDRTFIEIRHVLDGVDANLTEHEDIAEEPLHAPEPDPVMPYTMSRAQTPSGKSLSQRRAERDEDLPDWVADASDGHAEEAFTIGVDPSMVRADDAAPATPPPSDRHAADGVPESDGRPKPTPSPSRLGRTPAPVQPKRAPAAENPTSLADGASTNRTPRATGTIGIESNEVVVEAPTSPLAKVATFAIAGMLVFGIFMVVCTMALVGYGSYGVYDAGAAATASRGQLYDILRTDARTLIDQVADPGAPRTELEESYLAWYEAQTEPERSTAALGFLDDLESVASRRLTSAEGTQSLQEAQRTMRQLKASRGQYERDLEGWHGRADGVLGRVVIAIGAGTAPPQ